MGPRKWRAIVLLGIVLIYPLTAVRSATDVLESKRLDVSKYDVFVDEKIDTGKKNISWKGNAVKIGDSTKLKTKKDLTDTRSKDGIGGKLTDGKFGEACLHSDSNVKNTDWFGGKLEINISRAIRVELLFNKPVWLSSVTINCLTDDHNDTKSFEIFSHLDVNLHWNEKLQLQVKKEYKDSQAGCNVSNITIPLLNVAADKVLMNFKFPTARFAFGEIEFKGRDIEASTEIPCNSFCLTSNIVSEMNVTSNLWSSQWDHCIVNSVKETATDGRSLLSCSSQQQCPRYGCSDAKYTCLIGEKALYDEFNLTSNGSIIECSLQYPNNEGAPWSRYDVAEEEPNIYTCSGPGSPDSGTSPSPSMRSGGSNGIPLTLPSYETNPSSPTTCTVLPAASKLSDGAIAGIVISLLLVVIALLLLLIFLYCRRRRRRRRQKATLTPSDDVVGVKYQQRNGREAIPIPVEKPEPYYAVPPDCHTPIHCTVNGTGTEVGDDDSDDDNLGSADYAVVAISPMETVAVASLVARKEFPSIQEVQGYAEPESLRSSPAPVSKTKQEPPKKESRHKSVPMKVVMKLELCVKDASQEENIYDEATEPGGEPTSPPVPPKPKSKSVSYMPAERRRHQSGDSGIQEGPVYEQVGENMRSATVPKARRNAPALQKVVDLEIYASVDAVKRHSQLLSQRTSIVHEEDLTPEFLLDSSLSSESPLSPTSMLPYQSVYADPAPLLLNQGPLELPPEKFTQHKLIGQGQFGEVFQAFANQLLVENFTEGRSNGLCVKSMNVALKYLRKGATRDMQEVFNKEVKFMAPLRHEHVVRLLGVCSAEQPRFMVMEYMENGDLNQYLQRFTHPGRSEAASATKSISYCALLRISAQIASGMQYLESKFFIHRDLATRNCLVGANNVVKVADFGMTRSVYEKNYYRLAGRAILPIRWMAPETFYGKFTIKTDVWSFGVTCWEIFTLARCQPFQEMSDKDVIENAVKVEERVELERPDVCDDATYEMMMQCWNQKPEDRPSFGDLYKTLKAMAQEAD